MNSIIDIMNHEIGRQAKRESENWFIAQCNNPFESYYLYYKNSTQKLWGELRIENNPPDENFKIATPERISPMMTKEQVMYFIINKSRQLPIVPELL